MVLARVGVRMMLTGKSTTIENTPTVFEIRHGSVRGRRGCDETSIGNSGRVGECIDKTVVVRWNGCRAKT